MALPNDEHHAAIDELSKRANDAAEALQRFAVAVRCLQVTPVPASDPQSLTNAFLRAGVALDAFSQTTNTLLPSILRR